MVRLAARGIRGGRQHRRPRGCAVAPVAMGRPSSFPDAKGFSEENKSGFEVGGPMTEEVKADVQDMDGVINPGKGVEVAAPPTPISGNIEGSKWLTFYTEDESRTPYYFNQVTGETKW